MLLFEYYASAIPAADLGTAWLSTFLRSHFEVKKLRFLQFPDKILSN
jgi:hypothetical protein